MSDLPSELWQFEIAVRLHVIDRDALCLTCKALNQIIPYKQFNKYQTECDVEHLMAYQKLRNPCTIEHLVSLGRLDCIKYMLSITNNYNVMYVMLRKSLQSNQIPCFIYLFQQANKRNQLEILLSHQGFTLYDCFIKLDNVECLDIVYNIDINTSDNMFVYDLYCLCLSHDSVGCFEYLINKKSMISFEEIIHYQAIKCVIFAIRNHLKSDLTIHDMALYIMELPQIKIHEILNRLNPNTPDMPRSLEHIVSVLMNYK